MKIIFWRGNWLETNYAHRYQFKTVPTKVNLPLSSKMAGQKFRNFSYWPIVQQRVGIRTFLIWFEFFESENVIFIWYNNSRNPLRTSKSNWEVKNRPNNLRMSGFKKNGLQFSNPFYLQIMRFQSAISEVNAFKHDLLAI